MIISIDVNKGCKKNSYPAVLLIISVESTRKAIIRDPSNLPPQVVSTKPSSVPDLSSQYSER